MGVAGLWTRLNGLSTAHKVRLLATLQIPCLSPFICTARACFTPSFLNDPYHCTQLLDIRPFIFGLTPLIDSFVFTYVFFIDNIIFSFMPTLSGTRLGHKTRPLCLHVFVLYPTSELVKLKINLHLSPRHIMRNRSSTHSGSRSLVSGPHSINKKKVSLSPARLCMHTTPEHVATMNYV